MNPGLLRHRITLQKFMVITDPDGFTTQQWQDVATVWAAIENLHGREYWEAATVQAENTVKFTIRYRPDVTNDMRIVFRGQMYEITAIDNIKYRNEFLEIKAVALNAG
ncbi:MAG: phage head closure protein [Thermoanaerobacter sp.]|jgi:SPP1 family predicted phage head-tail adaptor|uniref:phage head closure protein n=1 Tax=Thermoanaerobacter sp. TaxID=1755 RepID=UPI003464E669